MYLQCRNQKQAKKRLASALCDQETDSAFVVVQMSNDKENM